MSFIPDALQKKKDKVNPKQDGSLVVATPITQTDDFCAEFAEGSMDFSSIIDKQFIVAVNTGSRNKPLLLASTIKGPFNFYEMVEAVGLMWEQEQHHAKVYALTKDSDKTSSFLDEGTVDYIEYKWQDIIATGILETAIREADLSPQIPAGLIVATPEEDQ